MVEIKRVKAELMRVKASKAEIEYQIELKSEEVDRLKATLERQNEAEVDLEAKLEIMSK